MAKKHSAIKSASSETKSQTKAAWFATLAAVISVLISCCSLYESHETRVAAFHDELIVRAQRPSDALPILLHKESGPLVFGAIRAPWSVLISNTGADTVSITGYEIRQIAGKLGNMYYSNIDGGLHSPDSMERVTLPISLDAGHSVRLLLVVGMNPGPKAYKLLLAAAGNHDAQMPLKEAEQLLAKGGVDIYDNTVSYLNPAEPTDGFRVDTQGKEQVFLLRFYTARGAQAQTTMSWYSLSGF